MNLKREDLEDYFEIQCSVIGTKGVKQKDSKYKIFTKKELIKRLKNVLPENEFGYSLIIAGDPKTKGQ